jgi:PAP2 superfamily
MWLPWTWGLVVAGLAMLGSVVAAKLSSGARQHAHRYKLAAPALREAAIVMCLYSLWQYVGAFSIMGVGDAFHRAKWIVDFQKQIWLPSEISVQKLLLPFPALVKSANLYYAIVHVPALVGTLFWAFFAHRSHYNRVRNALVLTTAACLAVQLIPVAPPRMLTDLGYVDTGVLYHQSVYDALGRGMAGQLAAMPSVHVAWAVIVGWFAVRAPVRWWLRVIAVSHAILTVLVVVVTGNHYWLDGIVAGLFLVASLILISAVERAHEVIRSRITSSSGDRVPIETS